MNVADPSLASTASGLSLPGRSEGSGALQRAQDSDPSTAVEMTTRVVKGANETVDHPAEGATPLLQQLERGLSRNGEVLHDKAEQWRTTGDEWAESLRGRLRELPLAAVAAALAVGVVIAHLAH